MTMNLHDDDRKVVSTIAISKSRETQAAGRQEDQTLALGPAIPSYARDRDDSKLPFAFGMNSTGSNALSTMLSSMLEQSSSFHPFQERPLQVQHELLSSQPTLQQQIATMNNADLLQLLLHQKIQSSSRLNVEALPLGFGVHNLSNSGASSIPSLGMLQPTRTVGKDQECASTGLRVLCPARGMPTDHDFERAHFTITPDMKHGEELRCSHPVCQAGGVKFCYCAICKKPAAKRNFRGRHHHIVDDPRVDAINDFSESLQRDEATMSIASAPQESLIKSINGMCAVASEPRNMMPISGAQQKPSHNVVDDTRSHHARLTTKSETRDSIFMSCKARGMPSDHNFKTAYFVITPSTQHGEDMECSYESCQEAGSKFSFCAYCRVPVAKRGFKSHCLQLGHDGCSSEKATPSRQSSEKNHVSDVSRDEYTNHNLLKDRMEKWNVLLENRPSKDHSEQLASWIKQVFEVSSIDADTTMEEAHVAISPSELGRSQEAVITELIDSVVSSIETSNCYSKDMNPKQPKMRKTSF